MDERLTVSDVLERLDRDEFGLSSGEESEFEGEEVFGYLPPAPEDLSGHVVSGGALREDALRRTAVMALQSPPLATSQVSSSLISC